ncbi:M14 family metallopeptidase [Draconibacterium sp.]|nr:M14 family metallopeptidase [Draconibacterium sp.]
MFSLRCISLYLIFMFLFLGVSAQNADIQIKTPKEFFGFQPGTDRSLFNYDPLIEYLQMVAEKSPRVKIIEIGESPMGKKMYVTFLSSEENIQNLDKLKNINKQLALNPELTEVQIKRYTDEGKVFIMAALSMHSTEVGPSQSAPLVAYEIATTSDTRILGWLDNVVYMMVPSHNPDGMDLVVNHYNKSKGTKYEGGSLPVVYHKYVGHDNNRDFVTLTQSDNRAVARLYNQSWFPQVMVEKHQMGSKGPRYFVPPVHDPIAENVDERIWNWTWIFGSNMAKDMAADGLAGVSQHYLFDDYWPGSTETALWKNVIGLLTECASVQFAKPIYIEKNELLASGKGLGEYKKSINMPLPWEGGWWRLSDIVDYELSSTWSIIKTGSIHRKDILLNRNALCKEEVEKGKTLAPAYYVLSANQHDESELIGLIYLLDEHGISVYKTSDKLQYKNKIIEKGDFIVPLAQPFRAFIKEVMEIQKFPERHYTAGGEMIEPYDITSWSLPLHRGVSTYQIDEVVEEIENAVEKVEFPIKPEVQHSENIQTIVFPVSNNESFKMAFAAMSNGIDVMRVTESFKSGDSEIRKGDFVIEITKKNSDKIHSLFNELRVNPISLSEKLSGNVAKLDMPRIALIETNFHDMDAGWTRFVFDIYKIPFTVVKPGEIKEKDLSDYDVIVFPDNDKSMLLEGKRKSSSGAYSVPSYDPQYTKGIEKEGVQKLMKFANDGGTIVSWGLSTGLFLGAQSIKTSEKEKEEFQLPVSDISTQLKSGGLYVPGSLLNVELKADHPLTLGMQKTAKVFSRGRPVFSTSIPYFDTDRRVIATYPEDEVLASGYAKNDEQLEGKSAMVWAKKGKGNFVLYGFYPQFRASTAGTYKLLFNALLLNE